MSGCDFAVATSGTAERGLHIRNPFTSAFAAELSSATVIGRSLTRADCYATAAVAIGTPATAWLDALPGYEGVTVTADGVVLTTSAADRILDADPTVGG